MDTLVKLALMTRASRVVIAPADRATKFLAFPTTDAFSFRPEQLRFAATLETKEDWQAYSEFSRIVNRVTAGAVYDANAEPLEDVVRDILDRGESAGAFDVALDDASLRAALALLYEVDQAGKRQPSAAVRLYQQYRDAVRVAEQFMRERKDSAELSNDPAVREAWREIESPGIERHLAGLREDWEAKAKRSAIDKAWETERAHAAADAGRTWQTWRGQFNADLDMPTDLHLNRFAATGFTPADLAESGDWNAIVMERGEIEMLANEAPQALRDTLSVGGQTTDIQRIALDYRTVGLDRPWLPRNLFTSRIWRFRSGGAPLSDGEGAGRCPAFPIGVVFARNIEVARQPAGAAAPQLMMLKAESLFSAIATPMVALNPAVTLHRPAFTDLGFMATRAGEVRDHRVRRGARDLIRDHRRAIAVATPAPPPAPVPAPAPVAEAPDPNITILAFICLRLPLCPDPDPALAWPSV